MRSTFASIEKMPECVPHKPRPSVYCFVSEEILLLKTSGWALLTDSAPEAFVSSALRLRGGQSPSGGPLLLLPGGCGQAADGELLFR